MVSSRDSRLGDEDTAPNVGRNRSNGDEPRHEPFSLDRPRDHQDQDRLNHDQDQANRHDDCRTLVLTTTLLLLPGPRDLFPSHSPPDWTRGCRMTRGHLPDWLGRACHARPSLIGWRNGPCPSLGWSLDLRRRRLRPRPQPKTRGQWSQWCGEVEEDLKI